jgi:hypothetical protein
MPESLREDPRLQEVLKKAGFPEKSQFMKRCSEARGDYYGVSLELDDLRSDTIQGDAETLESAGMNL